MTNDKWIDGTCDFCHTENVRVLVLWAGELRLFADDPAWDNRKPADHFEMHLCVFCCELPETGALGTKYGVDTHHPHAPLLRDIVKIAHVLMRKPTA